MVIEEKIQELEKQIESLKKECEKEEMEQWFKSLLNGIEIEINDKYPNEVFYKKNKKYFFSLEQNSNNKEERYLWCSYDLVWNILRNKYYLTDSLIQLFIKSMAEKYLKLKEVIAMNPMD